MELKAIDSIGKYSFVLSRRCISLPRYFNESAPSKTRTARSFESFWLGLLNVVLQITFINRYWRGLPLRQGWAPENRLEAHLIGWGESHTWNWAVQGSPLKDGLQLIRSSAESHSTTQLGFHWNSPDFSHAMDLIFHFWWLYSTQRLLWTSFPEFWGRWTDGWTPLFQLFSRHVEICNNLLACLHYLQPCLQHKVLCRQNDAE